MLNIRPFRQTRPEMRFLMLLPWLFVAGLACADDKAVTHMSAGAVVAALELAAGDVVNLSTANAGDRGIVTFIGVRL